MPPRRRPDPRLRTAVDLALAGGTPRNRLAERLGLSSRHLARLFRAGTGMGPGTLGRLARFQRVLRELERPGPVRWAALAARHGYFDQAHLCREFRRFGGTTPRRYLAAARELTRHFVADC
jgi:AraC-like DNA-binding protein